MTYYRFRVVGREARDISTVFNSALSRRGGEESLKKSPVLSCQRHQSRPILGETGTVATCLRLDIPGRRTQIPSDLRTRQIYLRPPAGKMARLYRGDRRRRPLSRQALETKRGYYSTSGAQEPQGVWLLPRSPSFSVKSRCRATFVVAFFFSLFLLFFFWLLKRSECAPTRASGNGIALQ